MNENTVIEEENATKGEWMVRKETNYSKAPKGFRFYSKCNEKSLKRLQKGMARSINVF